MRHPFEHDREFQRALLNHPAIVQRGVDPLWRWIAACLFAIVCVLVAMVARGEDLITERFMDALERVESGMDAAAVGDHGRSLGSYQFKAVAWAQVDTLRNSRGLATVPYLNGATNRVTARIYAVDYLRWLHTYLTRALHRSPSHQELYAVWNLGPAGFRARGFDLRRCPAHVRRAGMRINHEATKDTKK